MECPRPALDTDGRLLDSVDRCGRRKRNCRSLGCPGFPVESWGSGQLHVVLFRENHISGRRWSGEVGNPGTLGMTKGWVGVSSRNWFEGSQVSNARPGAPFDFTLRYCRGHWLCHFSPESPQRVGPGAPFDCLPNVMKNTFRPAKTLHGSVSLPFVIPTRISCHAALDIAACAPFSYGKAHTHRKGERSRGICSSADLSWKCFSTDDQGGNSVFTEM